MKTSVITVASGRHEHLRTQLHGLAMSTVAPDQHVVVSMGDPLICNITASQPGHVETVLMAKSQPLPLARARNLGADIALKNGAELLIFLDVDCVPHHQMIGRYREAAAGLGPSSLLCGPVTYLPVGSIHEVCAARELGRLTNPHPGRPHPANDAIVASDQYELFWSLSFAVHAQAWHRVGGFCDEYTGYGAEDTDFGQHARSVGVGLAWVGGAHAYHQHHLVSDPPVEHVDDILRNAALFKQRWGWWPMRGWLDAFAAAGLAEYDTDSHLWRRRDTAKSVPRTPSRSVADLL